MQSRDDLRYRSSNNASEKHVSTEQPVQALQHGNTLTALFRRSLLMARANKESLSSKWGPKDEIHCCRFLPGEPRTSGVSHETSGCLTSREQLGNLQSPLVSYNLCLSLQPALLLRRQCTLTRSRLPSLARGRRRVRVLLPFFRP